MGRELDERVAEVFGFARCEQTCVTPGGMSPPDEDGVSVGSSSWTVVGLHWHWPNGQVYGSRPRFSSDIDAAFLVVEAMRAKGATVSIAAYPEDRHGCAPHFQVEIKDGRESRADDDAQDIAYAVDDWCADGLPRAICLAALRALGVEGVGG